MDTVKGLLEKLDYKVSAKLDKMLLSYNKLLDKLEKAEDIYEKEPTPENEEALSEIKEYFEDYEIELIEMLQAEVAVKQATPPANNQTTDTPPVIVLENEDDNDTKKQSGISTLGIIGILGLALLTGGVINLWKK